RRGRSGRKMTSDTREKRRSRSGASGGRRGRNRGDESSAARPGHERLAGECLEPAHGASSTFPGSVPRGRRRAGGREGHVRWELRRVADLTPEEQAALRTLSRAVYPPEVAAAWPGLAVEWAPHGWGVVGWDAGGVA